jgi:hypothetical protein
MTNECLNREMRKADKPFRSDRVGATQGGEMFVARVLPFSPKRSRAVWLGISTDA